MARQLLELPPELLVHILALLPLKALLRFSETSHYARSLANSNLHTLSLGIRPVRTSCPSSRVHPSRYRQLQFLTSALVDPSPPTRPADDSLSNTSTITTSAHTPPKDTDSDTPMLWVRIPHAHTYDAPTLLHFHNALFQSILLRHGALLQHLSLTLWTLSPRIAKAIAQLPALRTFALRIEDNQYERALSRACMARERIEQDRAWTLLARSAVWTGRLRALRIASAELNGGQLAALLRDARACQDISLRKCSFIGRELWTFLGGEWAGRSSLQRLSVAECGSVLDEAALAAIGRLDGLKYLDLLDCVGADAETVESWNRDVWGVEEVVLPRERGSGGDAIIEVDPAYL